MTDKNNTRTKTGGKLIDRTKTKKFRFDGVAYHGYAGDTLASSLLGAGVRLYGRSFKYHRPRGLLAAGGEEPNALVTIRLPDGYDGHHPRKTFRETPNQRATQITLTEGLEAISQNNFPSLAFDVGATAGVFKQFLSAGFYYKTFMGLGPFRSNFAWAHIFEPLIRRSAGLGHAPSQPDQDHYDQIHAHPDLLVIGMGAAGLAAALTAAEQGAQVVICDENPQAGGSLVDESENTTVNGQAAMAWVQATEKTLRGHKNVTFLTHTMAFGLFADGFAGLVQSCRDHLDDDANPADLPRANLPRERLWLIRAKATLIAAGAIERPLVFPDNDRPGIMLAGAAQSYLARYGVVAAGQKRGVVVYTSCDSAYLAALEVIKTGQIKSLHLLDLRSTISPAAQKLRDALVAAGGKVTLGAVITEVKSAFPAGRGIKAITWRELDKTGQPSGAAKNIACDGLFMSGGWTPSLHLFSQARGKVMWDEASGVFLPKPGTGHNFAAPVYTAGACAGQFSIKSALQDGVKTALDALRFIKFATAATPSLVAAQVSETAISWAGSVGATPHGHDPRKIKAFVDFQNDVTEGDIGQAVQEGMRSIEHIKRFTTTGMATDQGRLSNLNALAIASAQLGKPVPEIGLTTFRMPFAPVSFGLLAGPSRGDLFDPMRTTPMHTSAVAHHAVFEDVGQWKRAHYFPRAGESMHQAVDRECLTVHNHVGLFDASTLGKIEVVGRDAAEFLERIYINNFKKLAPGRCRYGLLLNEAGFVMDDGVIARLAENRFHVTTTTGGAARVLSHMEDYLQTEWPDLQVWLTSISEQFGVIAVQGPKSRALLSEIIDPSLLDGKILPHMAYAEIRAAGASGQHIPLRLFRVSFSGEMGFELNIPAAQAQYFWDRLSALLPKYSGTHYGTEAMHILRAEKGYIIVGQETDGTMTPDDVGLAGMIGKDKKDFVGKRSLTRVDMVAGGRPQLVGLRPHTPHFVPDEGAQIVLSSGFMPGTPAAGFVTSSYHSALLERSFCLAVVKDGRRKIGETVYIAQKSGCQAVDIVAPVFYDPEGKRLAMDA
ncbi:MAG: sarcosine oxidase subunit alpha family protein [Candidatus Symbiobacter sp.]|nr:sarcosine oxidase subunit alpha family protein [Candidatus Symbiobacter sp.]